MTEHLTQPVMTPEQVKAFNELLAEIKKAQEGGEPDE